MEKIRKWLERLPAFTLSAVCLAAILWLTLASRPLGDNDIQLFPHADKVVHAVMFGGFVFCILLDRVRTDGWRRTTSREAAAAAMAAVALGIFTEVAQNAMHLGRSGDPADLLADAAGAILSAGAFHFYSCHFEKK